MSFTLVFVLCACVFSSNSSQVKVDGRKLSQLPCMMIRWRSIGIKKQVQLCASAKLNCSYLTVDLSHLPNSNKLLSSRASAKRICCCSLIVALAMTSQGDVDTEWSVLCCSQTHKTIVSWASIKNMYRSNVLATKSLFCQTTSYLSTVDLQGVRPMHQVKKVCVGDRRLRPENNTGV